MFLNRNKRSSEILIAYNRGEFVEGLHRGAIAVVTADGRIISSVGDYSQPVLIRSCAKPFQLITVLASGAVEQFSLKGEELAVAAASHSAELEHIKAVESILRKIGMSENDLRCGVHPPCMGHIMNEMVRNNIDSTPLYNNCSGKHAAMLAACLARGWPTENYDSADHLLQQENLEVTAAFAGLNKEKVGVAVDGCTVPTFALPLKDAAMAYARLADPDLAPDKHGEMALKTFKIMNSHPYYGSGKIGRLEAALMTLFPGRLIAKVGAEAFFAIAVAPGIIDKRGAGIVVKLEDGITFNRACDPVVVDILRQLGLLDDSGLERLKEFYPMEVLNCRGECVGDVKILFNLFDQ